MAFSTLFSISVHVDKAFVVLLQFEFAFAHRSGADDATGAFRQSGAGQETQPFAFGIGGDFPRDADNAIEGYQNHVAAGNSDLGGYAHALVAIGLANHLDDDPLAGFEVDLDLAGAFRIENGKLLQALF
mgnify:CR=1 FL=1